ncbi:Trimethylamine-N-oxide reductase (Cytochrome c) [plant metagenome]|uniref:Trimethylamine-N-oxide reductase (Cytochrome c) n=1 Tax=plant metagenome TaxID=1297885 RepID=A0A484RDN4_9ZZZZ
MGSHFTATHWGVYLPRVEDGRVVALAPAPWDASPSPIGGSVPGAIDGPTRVRRPAVRAGFLDPRTRRASAALRGQDAYVEVPWDEALDLAAGELARVRSAHGNGAIFGGSYGWSSAGRFHHAQGQLHRFLNAFGGYVASRDSYSLGAGRVLMPHIVADMDTLLREHTSWDVLAEHCELFVCLGGLPLKNAQVSPGGASDHLLPTALRRLSERGVRFINVSPVRDDLQGVAQVQWLPIRPGSDTAFLLAIAHVLFHEGLADETFLASHTTGWTTLRDYVLGHGDGQPKTPAWAASRTGLAAHDIAALAREMASRRTLINTAYSLQRAWRGEQPFWMTVAVAALLGQVGLPGGGFGLGYGCMNNTGSGRAPFSGPRLPQGHNPVQDFIPVARVADMLLRPGLTYDYNGQALRYPDIRLIYWAGGNAFHHHQDLYRLARAWHRPETIIVHEQYWTAQARHADIVLPATTFLERDDIGSSASDRYLIAMKAAIPPIAEARDDYAILSALARRLDCEEAYTEGRDAGTWLRLLYDASRARAQSHGIALPAFDAFWRAGRFEVPLPARPMVLLEDFRRDPAASPLPTPSGRIELYSTRIASFGYDDCPGHPAWFDPPGTPYPLHLLSNQPATRLHSQYDQGALSRASKIQEREPLTMNPEDARPRGIADGDIVRVHNGQGAFLAAARLSAGIRQGVVQIATGAWYDPLTPGTARGLDKHGNPNVVTQDIGASRLSQGCAAQSTSVEITRWDGPLPPVTAFVPPAGIAMPPSRR